VVIIAFFIQDNIDRENLVAGTQSDRQCKMTLRNAFVSNKRHSAAKLQNDAYSNMRGCRMTSAEAGGGFVSSVAVCCGTLNLFPSAGGKGLRGYV